MRLSIRTLLLVAAIAPVSRKNERMNEWMNEWNSLFHWFLLYVIVWSKDGEWERKEWRGAINGISIRGRRIDRFGYTFFRRGRKETVVTTVSPNERKSRQIDSIIDTTDQKEVEHRFVHSFVPTANSTLLPYFLPPPWFHTQRIPYKTDAPKSITKHTPQRITIQYNTIQLKSRTERQNLRHRVLGRVVLVRLGRFTTRTTRNRTSTTGCLSKYLSKINRHQRYNTTKNDATQRLWFCLSTLPTHLESFFVLSLSLAIAVAVAVACY